MPPYEKISRILYLKKEQMYMNLNVESILFCDPQAQPPAGYCPCCGGCLYWPGLHCIRCEEGIS